MVVSTIANLDSIPSTLATSGLKSLVTKSLNQAGACLGLCGLSVFTALVFTTKLSRSSRSRTFTLYFPMPIYYILLSIYILPKKI